MKSKRSSKLFNKEYSKNYINKADKILSNNRWTRYVSVKSIKVGKHDKYLNVRLPKSNPTNQTSFKVSLNRNQRPAYQSGSKEMYRHVNGLCQYCGHDHYNAKLVLNKDGGYILDYIKCSKCKKTQDISFIGNSKQINKSRDRAKEYHNKNKKNNNKKKL